MLVTVRANSDAQYNDARMTMERHGGDVRGTGVGSTSGTMGTTRLTDRPVI